MMGKASREEREEVESWAGGSAERKRFVEDARGFYAGEEIPDGEIEQRMRRIWQTMPVSIWRRRMIFRWAAAVACVLLAVGIGWSVWLPGTREGRMMPDGQEQGVQAVQLLLSDGSRHELGPGRLSGSIPGFRVDTGGVIRQEAVASGPGGDTVRYGEIMVPRGGEYRMVLADGTRVMLNAETRLRFPEAFGDGERRVFLEGEAYFEVTHKGGKPFVVRTDKCNVEVLGTKFNVEAYSDSEDFCTSLMEGSVRVSDKKKPSESLVLAPNQQVSWINGHLQSKPIADFDPFRWKEGLICFKSMHFKELMSRFEKCYGIHIIIENPKLADYICSGKFRISDGIDKALRILQKDAKYTFERNKDESVIYIK